MGRVFYADPLPPGADYLSVADSSDLRLNGVSFSVVAWTKYTGTIAAGMFPRIISKLSGAPYNGWELLQYQDGTYYLQVGTAGTLRTCFTAATVSANADHQIVATYNESNGDMKIYVDGSLSNTATGAAGAVGSGTLGMAIGRFPSDANYVYAWTGNIYDVAIYSGVVLGADRISEQYNGRLSPEFLRANGVFCSRLSRDLTDVWGGKTITAFNSPDPVDHCRMHYPRGGKGKKKTYVAPAITQVRGKINRSLASGSALLGGLVR